MKLNPVPEYVAQTGLRAVKSVCLANGKEKLSDLQIQFLKGIQKHILNTDYDLESLTQITPHELRSLVTEAEFRERIIRACIIAACIEGSMDKIAVAQVEQYAKALQADMAPVKAAWKLANESLILARMDIVRKSLPGVKIKQTIKKEGIFAMIKQFFPLIGIQTSKTTERYKQLENYPEGTLGKEFMNYIHNNHFPLPGEKGAGPEIITLHDCLHILGDYGTSATEEIEIASFQAGCQYQDPIYGILFGLAQYHLNIQVAPVAPSQSLQANPEKMIAAFARGCRVQRDMWRDFVPWEHFNRPVDELRKELGIGPK